MINQTLQKLAIKIRPFQIKLELVLLTILLIGLILKDSEIAFLLIFIPLQILAMLYLIMAFRLKNPEKIIVTFLNKLLYLSFSVGTIGILFAIQHYPYSYVMLQIALLTIVLGLIGLFIVKFRDDKKIKIVDSDFIRIFVIAIAIASLMAFGY